MSDVSSLTGSLIIGVGIGAGLIAVARELFLKPRVEQGNKTKTPQKPSPSKISKRLFPKKEL